MYSYRCIYRLEREVLGQVCHYEFGRFVQVHALYFLAHAVQAGALVAEYRPLSLLRSQPQFLFELPNFLLSYVGHAFAFPYHAAAKLLYVVGINNFESGALKQLQHYFGQRFVVGLSGCGTHSAVDAGREVYNFALLLRLSCGFKVVWLRQVGSPQRHTGLVQGPAQDVDTFWPYDGPGGHSAG